MRYERGSPLHHGTWDNAHTRSESSHHAPLDKKERLAGKRVTPLLGHPSLGLVAGISKDTVILSPKDLRTLFEKLQIWSSKGQRAPHKPLLVLWAIGRCLAGEPRLVPFEVVRRELTTLLGSFGPHRKTVHTEAPFWRLQNDGVWVIDRPHLVKVGPGGNAHISTMLRHGIRGGFPQDTYDALRKDRGLARNIARSLVAAHFPATRLDEILQATDIDPYEFVESRHRPRDLRFRQAVLHAYGSRCAICGFAVRVTNAPPALALDAAHIQWHQARGPDIVNNGLALCALHHRLFDDGVFTLSLVPDLIVEVAPSATGSGFNESLGCFHGQSPRILPPTGGLPDPRFLLWHRKEVFRSFKAYA